MNYPLVSIILPTYNGAEYIEKALESLSSQTYPNYEILISDDNSNDSTYSICEKYTLKNNNIHLSKNKKNLGGTENFIATLHKSKGEFALWAQQDDIWHKDFIMKLYKPFSKNKDIVISMCKTAIFDEDEKKIIDYYNFDNKFNPSNMNNFQLAKNTVKCLFPDSKMVKFNIFIHGLIKSIYLKNILNNYLGLFATERHLLVHLALIGSFKYTDELLYYRKIYYDENRRKHTKSYKNRNVWYAPFRNFLQINFSIFTSSHLKFNKKVYIIPIMLIYYYERFLLILIPILRNILPLSLYNYFKSIYQINK